MTRPSRPIRPYYTPGMILQEAIASFRCAMLEGDRKRARDLLIVIRYLR